MTKPSDCVLPSGSGEQPSLVLPHHPPVYLNLQPIERLDAIHFCTTGEPLPHLFTLTFIRRRFFSVPFTKHYCLPVVNRYGALCCSDFPLTKQDYFLRKSASLYERQTNRANVHELQFICCRSAKVEKKSGSYNNSVLYSGQPHQIRNASLLLSRLLGVTSKILRSSLLYILTIPIARIMQSLHSGQ